MIFISAGHHKEAQGTSLEHLTEFGETRIWANIINELTEQVVMVPSGRLADKVRFINDQIFEKYSDQVNIAVEVHFNAAPKKKGEYVGHGCETLHFYGSDKGKVLAEHIQKKLAVVFSPDRGIKEGWYYKKDIPHYFLAKTTCPAVIVEPEFFYLQESIINNRGSGCRAILKGCLSYLASLS